MSLVTLNASDALQQLGRFDAVIDARSPAEFALDHLPGAVNWPTLDDAQRAAIGTLYKQVNPFEARKRGAALAARNIAAHIEAHLLSTPRSWQPLLYCWRGGQRSGSLALVLGQIGFKVTLLEGGYKAFRGAMVQDFAPRVAPLALRVVCGPTGSGKTRLLHALAQAGAQVLDLEALANHRSSVLGIAPGQCQPSQKHFETRVWDALRGFDPAQPVFVESESKKVGNVSVPEALMSAMRQSPCLDLRLPDDERVQLPLEDYDYLVRDVAYFCNRLQVLVPLKGRAVVGAWQALARAGDFALVVRELLTQHYDPAYGDSMQRNFGQFAQAQVLAPADRSPQAMQALAATLTEALPGADTLDC
jgi:tRNA 2-selenouridine synthase